MYPNKLNSQYVHNCFQKQDVIIFLKRTKITDEYVDFISQVMQEHISLRGFGVNKSLEQLYNVFLILPVCSRF